MDGTGEHYAKWNKAGGERQIPYDLTYKWNLINKTNKQAKYNQRHWNKEQTDSNQREAGRAIMGENRGRAIKEYIYIYIDTRRKPKWVSLRVGGGDGWGGRAW